MATLETLLHQPWQEAAAVEGVAFSAALLSGSRSGSNSIPHVYLALWCQVCPSLRMFGVYLNDPCSYWVKVQINHPNNVQHAVAVSGALLAWAGGLRRRGCWRRSWLDVTEGRQRWPQFAALRWSEVLRKVYRFDSPTSGAACIVIVTEVTVHQL